MTNERDDRLSSLEGAAVEMKDRLAGLLSKMDELEGRLKPDEHWPQYSVEWVKGWHVGYADAEQAIFSEPDEFARAKEADYAFDAAREAKMMGEYND